MFSALLRLCGITPNAAAHYLGEHRRQVLAWVREQQEPPREVILKMCELCEAQEAEVDRIIEQWERAGQPAEITYLLPADDFAARRAGWPAVTAQMAAAAKAQATLTEVSIVFATAAPEEGEEPAAGA